jgi:TP901 family phage tail tape measure protein
MSLSKNLRLEVILQGIDRLTKPLKGVLGASRSTAQEVKTLRDRLKDLDRSQKMLGEFKSVGRGLAVTKHQLSAAQERVAAIKQQMAAPPPAQTESWKQFTAARMGEYMRSEGSHAAAMKRLGAEWKALKGQGAGVAVPPKQLAAALKAAEKEAAALGMRHGKLYAQEVRLRESLTAAGLGTTGLTAQQRALKTQSDEVSRSLALQVQRLQQLNRKQQQMHAARARYEKGMQLRNQMAGTGAGMLAAGVAAGGAIAAPVKAYADAEDAGTQLKVAMMTRGAQVAPEFDRINALALQLGNRLPGTTADFQNMMTMLIRQGMSAQAILGGLGEATAYLGVQLKLPVTEAAEFASKLQDATRTSERDMMSLMDVIQKTFYLGVDHNNMLQAFAKLSPAMDTIKQKGLEGARALAPLIVLADQAGMEGEAAGNAYRKVFQMALDPKKIGKANAALKELGVSLDFSNGKGEFGGFDKLFSQLQKLRGLSTQKRLSVIKQIFGDDAETLQVVSLLIEKGKAGYDEVQAKMAAQASLQERVNQQLSTLKNLWDAASGTFTNALVAFGEAISPELKQVTQWINDVSEALGNWAKAHPQLAGWLMKTAAIIAVVLTALGGLTLALAAVLGPMMVVRYGVQMLGIEAAGAATKLLQFKSMGSVFGALSSPISSLARTVVPLLSGALSAVGAAIMATPIGWILAGVAAIAAAGLLLHKYWAPIKAFFAGLWDGLAETAGPVLRAWWDASVKFGSALLDLLRLVPGVGLVFTAVGAIVGPVLGFLIDGAKRLWQWLTNLLTPVQDVGGEARNMGQAFGRVLGDLVGWLVALPTRFLTAGAQAMQGLANGITSAMGAVKAAITGAADSVVGWFKEKLGIHSPSRVFATLGGFTMQGLDQGLTAAQKAPLATVQDFTRRFTAVGAGIALAAPAVAGVGLDGRQPIVPPAPLVRPQTQVAQSATAPLSPTLDGALLDFTKRLSALGAGVPVAAPAAARTGVDARLTINPTVPLDNRPPVSAARPAQASAAAGNTYVFQIYAAPGMDEQKLARLVQQKIEEAERGKAARTRGRLADKD